MYSILYTRAASFLSTNPAIVSFTPMIHHSHEYILVLCIKSQVVSHLCAIGTASQCMPMNMEIDGKSRIKIDWCYY